MCIKLSAGRIVDATIKAIRETTEGASFGEETALIAGTFTAGCTRGASQTSSAFAEAFALSQAEES
jgi:hypothetical protein